MHRSILTLGPIGLLAALAACPNSTEPCVKSETPVVNSFSTALTNGAPVAVFRLDQTVVSYQPAGCDASGGPVMLTLTSSAPVALRFDYTIQGLNALGGPAWSFQGSIAKLAPGQTLVVGQVANTPVRVDVGARAFLANVFVVP